MRPEITPTLARMVNARIHSLPRPIKWFSVPRLWRAENPQKGRLREFFQWNVDIIGSDDVLADAECIFTAVDLLGEVGLTPQEAQVHIGSRPLTTAALRQVGVPEQRMEAALAALDKRPRLGEEQFARAAGEAGIPPEGLERILAFQDAADLDQARALLDDGRDVQEAAQRLETLLEHLEQMGAGEFCRLDLRIVRGLAYYTGIVYEVLDTAGRLRAIAGGGRYDNLLEVLGGPRVGATGFGMGDAVLEILLEEKGKLPQPGPGLDCFVIDAGENLLGQVLRTVGHLRRQGLAADYSFKRQSLGKQLKEANRRRARYALIVRPDGVGVKDLDTGAQSDVPIEALLAEPGRFLGGGASDGGGGG